MSTSAGTLQNICRTIVRFAGDTRGATAIEYALIAAGVGAAVAGTVYALGTKIQDSLYNKINSAM